MTLLKSLEVWDGAEVEKLSSVRSCVEEAIPVDGPNEEQIRDDNTQSLKHDRPSRCILQIIHLEHIWIKENSDLREQPFEVSKKGRVVERPFTRVLRPSTLPAQEIHGLHTSVYHWEIGRE